MCTLHPTVSQNPGCRLGSDGLHASSNALWLCFYAGCWQFAVAAHWLGTLRLRSCLFVHRRLNRTMHWRSMHARWRWTILSRHAATCAAMSGCGKCRTSCTHALRHARRALCKHRRRNAQIRPAVHHHAKWCPAMVCWPKGQINAKEEFSILSATDTLRCIRYWPKRLDRSMLHLGTEMRLNVNWCLRKFCASGMDIQCLSYRDTLTMYRRQFLNVTGHSVQHCAILTSVIFCMELVSTVAPDHQRWKDVMHE
mmetsp:Transcript_33276/g.99103  ORF Transcript_33276/g.99103 Transcript_33276/m.99103 type:complete len:253 (+) Transcript_33276:300-1058(+)